MEGDGGRRLLEVVLMRGEGGVRRRVGWNLLEKKGVKRPWRRIVKKEKRIKG